MMIWSWYYNRFLYCLRFGRQPAWTDTAVDAACGRCRKTASAPYSKFRVGAAIQMDNGEVVIGSNQENAAYPSGLCAERVAVFHAGAAYPEAKILSLAISAAADAKVVDTPIPPCGACRQVLAEYEMKQDTPIEIWFMGEAGKVYKSDSLKNLLPLIFDKDYL